ncbi:MAG: tRNA preQ1(34) S-adenosylmethionine ribosyltransferase-isomerase QueA [Candidatus Omnitrophota bacterium]|jgi:S-adenosylmethionine:tRNA ribosyltransferase-isomerase
MKLADFDYHLPRELIAEYPLAERDQARLMVLNRSRQTIEHRIFKDIIGYFSAGDLLVLNDTKVLACRLYGRRSTGGKVEILLLNRKNGLTFEVLLKPHRLKLNEKIELPDSDISAVITAKNEVTFCAPDSNSIYSLGVVPLPPYIKRKPEAQDSIDYQTVYAKSEGSIASPTAGLHFTEALLARIAAGNVEIGYVTLHVGHATFQPVKAEDVISHRMGREQFCINDETKTSIDRAQQEKRRIFAVGTTSCRTIETYACGKQEGYTDLFIYPGYQFKLVNCFITNFHLPRTTLFMLSCAFAGEQFMKRAYQEAIEQKYRFYSYGDAMLIV